MRASLKDNSPFAMAGLWETWVSKKTGEVINSFTVITTEPNDIMKLIHDRMPVILLRQDVDLWLNNEIPTDELLKLLHPYPDKKMKVESVSKAVNRAGYDDRLILMPDCDEPEDMKLF